VAKSLTGTGGPWRLFHRIERAIDASLQTFVVERVERPGLFGGLQRDVCSTLGNEPFGSMDADLSANERLGEAHRHVVWHDGCEPGDALCEAWLVHVPAQTDPLLGQRATGAARVAVVVAARQANLAEATAPRPQHGLVIKSV